MKARIEYISAEYKSSSESEREETVSLCSLLSATAADTLDETMKKNEEIKKENVYHFFPLVRLKVFFPELVYSTIK